MDPSVRFFDKNAKLHIVIHSRFCGLFTFPAQVKSPQNRRALDGYGGLRSCEHRHGVGVKNGVKRVSEAVAALTQDLTIAVGSGGQGESILWKSGDLE